MLIYSIILLLISAAVSNKRDNSILFSRITILALINTIIILTINFDINFINKTKKNLLGASETLRKLTPKMLKI